MFHDIQDAYNCAVIAADGWLAEMYAKVGLRLVRAEAKDRPPLGPQSDLGGVFDQFGVFGLFGITLQRHRFVLNDLDFIHSVTFSESGFRGFISDKKIGAVHSSNFLR
jgi:hypothetical protein